MENHSKNPSPLSKIQEISSVFLELVEIFSQLRDPVKGCPWDLEQTHQTLKRYLIEECYEVIEAIEVDRQKLPDELGDVLLQVLLHSQIASEAHTFDILTVLKTLRDKIVRRHPHVFGSSKLENASEVRKQWDEIKKSENSGTDKARLLSRGSDSIPSLLQAERLGADASQCKFDWKSPQEVIEKIEEELAELKEALSDPERASEELGDLLFSVAQLSRKMSLSSEQALRSSSIKFEHRFNKMLELTSSPLSELSDEQREELWLRAKESFK